MALDFQVDKPVALKLPKSSFRIQTTRPRYFLGSVDFIEFNL